MGWYTRQRAPIRDALHELVRVVVVLLATLVACAAKHLLVLLFAHALATLLDKRTHKAYEPIGTMQKKENPLPLLLPSGIVQLAGQRVLVPLIGVRVLFPELHGSSQPIHQAG